MPESARIVRIALANLAYPATADDSVVLARDAIARAGREGAVVICFPEVFVPGYRKPGETYPPPDEAFLERAWTDIARAAAMAKVTVVLGTERIVDGKPRITTLVIGPDGTRAGFQDKLQLDPTEEPFYSPGSERRLFQAGALTFGLSICHEGFRYPETVRWSARQGAHLVFHPHFSWAEEGGFRPTTFADPRNTFHEKAVLCRAAENTCFVASVNYATDGSPTTSVVARPDGSVLAWQPYGEPGLLLADIDIGEATGYLASRLRPAAP
jgi:predicted amidohydrolase